MFTNINYKIVPELIDNFNIDNLPAVAILAKPYDFNKNKPLEKLPLFGWKKRKNLIKNGNAALIIKTGTLMPFMLLGINYLIDFFQEIILKIHREGFDKLDNKFLFKSSLKLVKEAVKTARDCTP